MTKEGFLFIGIFKGDFGFERILLANGGIKWNVKIWRHYNVLCDLSMGECDSVLVNVTATLRGLFYVVLWIVKRTVTFISTAAVSLVVRTGY